MTTKYCDVCGIELHSENNKESTRHCDECADGYQDDLYEDFDE